LANGEPMTEVHAIHTPPPARARGGEPLVAWLRELEECRIGGLVSDEDYSLQRAEKLTALLRPVRCLWLASLLGALLTAAPAAAAFWWYTHDWRFTSCIAVIAGAWGLGALGRLLREKFTELQLRGRRKTLVTLLENDLLIAAEFADFDERLTQGRQDVV
jgi:hypothetical protein